MRIFGKRKCKFIANFSATMVTSIPSHYFRLSLSLSPIVPHAQYRKRFRASYSRTGQNLIICLGFSITRRAARAIQERVGTKRANFLATERVNCEFQRHNGETGSVKGETRIAIFLAGIV